MIDILICALPDMVPNRPPAAPALLKSAVISAGFTASTVDFSQRFHVDQCGFNFQIYTEYCSVFRPDEKATEPALCAAAQWVDASILYIREKNPRYIGLSIFTLYQHRAGKMLAEAIRRELPKLKIIIGGFGINNNCKSLGQDADVKKIELVKSFAQFMQDRKLCDHVVYGDENELVALLENSINIPHTGKTFETPIPDYNDYNLDYYVWNNERSLPITGSKGCVKDCTFCDVNSQFGKFKFRDGTKIAHEMIYLKEKYGIRVFEFTDSLVNGSLKAFREWMKHIADYNASREENDKIKWYGQYICRPQKHLPADYYQLMKDSGSVNLVVGVESGSNHVLAAMNKNMKIEDVLEELLQFEKYNLHAQLLILSGYVNETWDYFLETLKLIVACHRYTASGTVTKIAVGHPLYIYDKTPLYQNAEKYGIVLSDHGEMFWQVKDDPNYDFPERMRRRIITQAVLDTLDIPISGLSVIALNQLLAAGKQYESTLQRINT